MAEPKGKEEPLEQQEGGEEPAPDTEQGPGQGEGEGEGEGEAAAQAASSSPPKRKNRRRRKATAKPAAEPDTAGEFEPPEGFKVCPVCVGAGAVPEGVELAPDAEMCEGCGGHGLVASGSLVPEHALIPCIRCGGQGYTVKPGEPAPVAPLEQGAGERPPPPPPPPPTAVVAGPLPWPPVEPAPPEPAPVG